MNIFQADIKTATRQNNAEDDNKPPDWGKLNPASISADDAIKEVSPGADTKFIRGDYGEVIFADRETVIFGNDVQKIQKDHTETIEGRATVTIKNGRKLMIRVIDDAAVLGARKRFVLGHDEETYSEEREVHEPKGLVETKWKDWSLTGMCIEGKGVAFEAKGLLIALESLQIVAGMFNETNELIEAQLRQLHGVTYGLDGKLGLLALHLMPRGNGGPTISTSRAISSSFAAEP